MGLDLSCGMLQGTIYPNTSLFDLPHLQRLNLAYNDFSGRQIPREIGRFSKSLTHFNIFECTFSGQVPTEITLLHKLVSLDLSWNTLSLEPHVFINLLQNSTSLGELSLNYVGIHSVLPKYLNMYASLKLIELGLTGLTGKLPDYIFSLQTLEILDLSFNNFIGQLIGQIDQAAILQLTNLTGLGLSNNNFSGDWELDTLLSSLKNLEYLDLSYSGLSITTSNATHHVNHNMRHLRMASCKIKVFPEAIQSMRNLEWLDLSSNEIHGDIPIWAREIGGLPLLRLYGLQEIYLQSNRIQGPFPPSICNMSLLSLDLSNNSFGGVIPQCFGNSTSHLFSLNLGNNDFHGTIPDMFDGWGELRGLILNGNQLEGEVPTSLSSCVSLTVLDLADNQLNGTFPDWVGGLSQLQVLNLKSNKFHGPIVTSSPVESFQSLRVLDLSYNRFVGQLPQKYFQNFNAMMGNEGRSTEPVYMNMDGLYYSVVMTVKGQDLWFPQISVDYMIIDLSNNGFKGEIPNIIGNLTSLIVLNLSLNNLTGQIPHALGNLKEIESLDLSCNRLTWEIPPSLADNTNLEYLNLSENSLAGHILEGNQFRTFDVSSFQGNPKLCGFPLPNKCSEHPHEPHVEDDGEDEEEDGFTWRVVMMGYGCGTFVGLLMGYLMLSTGRPKWFNAIADAGEHFIQIDKATQQKIHIYWKMKLVSDRCIFIFMRFLISINCAISLTLYGVGLLK